MVVRSLGVLLNIQIFSWLLDEDAENMWICLKVLQEIWAISTLIERAYSGKDERIYRG